LCYTGVEDTPRRPGVENKQWKLEYLAEISATGTVSNTVKASWNKKNSNFSEQDRI
jgi:hypothetical protein